MVSDGETWVILWRWVILPAPVIAEPYIVLDCADNKQGTYLVLQIAGF